jgi:enterochelin esterase family protein
MTVLSRRALLAGAMLLAALPATAQEPAKRPARPPQVLSPEVGADRKVTFRLLAPGAESVRLAAGDIPGNGRGVELTKGEGGVWEATVGPVPAGAYRYQFNVDGVPTIDPRNPATSESNQNTWSLVVVPGSDAFDTRDVPHGAVSQVTYHSKSLGKSRRMHVYTPPGYETGEGTYPVFYLLHGASDSDASWSTVGRAGAILDNLIAAGKARPMIVVMPAGHTGPFTFGGGGSPLDRQIDAFGEDFTKELRPHVESRYRVKNDRAHRAIAGLSMGGAQTLNLAFAKPDDFAYVGVFSSGIFGIVGRPGGDAGAAPNRQWEDAHKAVLDDPALKSGLKLLWFGCGEEDFLIQTSRATVDMLTSHGLDVTSKETDGGHTWLNWRDYLAEFAPQLFPGE